MAHDDGEGLKLLPASGRARRRFLMDSALATAGVSAAAIYSIERDRKLCAQAVRK